jgi:uncharacterized protein YecT (DUF1311 family)
MLVVALLLIASFSYCLDEKVHPIDKAYDDCISTDTSTSNLIECAGTAYEQWDQELNRVYKELQSKLDDQGRRMLRDSQRKWIEFRDLEFELLGRIYSQMSGTMYVPWHVYSRARIVKERTLLLTKYIELLEHAEED